jgi:hypothetical protein
MKWSVWSPWFFAILCLTVALLCRGLQAQTKATCNFSLFTFPNSIPQGDFADGVNSFATVVGTVEETNHNKVGLIRFSGGSSNFFSPGASTQINARNDVGNSVGNEFTSPPKGFFLHGSSGVTYIIHSNDANGTFPRGKMSISPRISAAIMDSWRHVNNRSTLTSLCTESTSPTCLPAAQSDDTMYTPPQPKFQQHKGALPQGPFSILAAFSGAAFSSR